MRTEFLSETPSLQMQINSESRYASVLFTKVFHTKFRLFNNISQIYLLTAGHSSAIAKYTENKSSNHAYFIGTLKHGLTY